MQLGECTIENDKIYIPYVTIQDIFKVLYYITYCIPITNLECESIFNYFSFCSVLIRQPIHIFYLKKFIVINKYNFINTYHIILFIMKLLV
jgi:hypothetical protein